MFFFHKRPRGAYEIVYAWYEEQRDNNRALRVQVSKLEYLNAQIALERDELALQLIEARENHEAYVHQTSVVISTLGNRIMILEVEGVPTSKMRVNTIIDTGKVA